MIEKNASGLYEVTVDGRKYEFQKWGASDSLKILTRIAKIISEPLGVVMGNLMAGSKGEVKKLLEMDFDPEMISKAVRSLMFNLEEDICINLVKKLSSEQVFCDGAKINFDAHYQDQLDHLFKVVAANVEVQYGNFFGALRGLLVNMVPKSKTISNKVHRT